ncbi:hypothetical protein AB2L57_06050 [Microbacterium sp. HA-8]|uniref:hypothetical protein n=1 Tax=Microbacterium sp. HA-8 TaxID=3234200 RepID=UPI0038F7DBBB
MSHELVEELLASVAPAANARSQLVKHLAAEPGVLTAGGSRMPKVVSEFIYAAIAAGIDGLVSPSCALCSRPRTLFHTHGDGERICTSCYSRQHTATCSGCGREDRRIKARTADGQPICSRCHEHARPQQPCDGCGRPGSVKQSVVDGRRYCRSCRAKQAPTAPCVVCGQQRRINARTDDGGAICTTCYAKARTGTTPCDECGQIAPLQTRADGRTTTSTNAGKNLCARCYRYPRRLCGVCGRHRRVALKATDTSPDICPTCYQAPVVDCSICGQQALGRRTTNHGRPRCFSCQTIGQIDAALTGPDGLIRPELVPVRDALAASDRPRSLLTNWHNLSSLHLLSDIAQGRLELSHEALDARPQVFSVTYLRAMLVAADALPPRDENAVRLRRYAAEAATDITNPEFRGALSRYARWHVIGRVKTNRHGHISPTTAGRAKANIQSARNFIDHLTASGHTLHDFPQAQLETWLSRDSTRRIGFIRWLKQGGYLTRCQLPDPIRQKDPSHDVDPEEQLGLARRLLHDPDAASVEDRAAACLILLYAQPVTKIAALTTSDIQVRDAGTYLTLGPEPLLLIPPLDAMVKALPVAKPFGTASTLADPRWLFTSKNAGTHLHPTSLMARMNRLGITTRASRNTALLHLAATTPPAVFASLVGIHITTATRWAELTGAAWNNYAAHVPIRTNSQQASRRERPR